MKAKTCAFGVGKTTVATRRLESIPNAMLYDLEEVGYMLRKMITQEIRQPDEQIDNFQDMNCGEF